MRFFILGRLSDLTISEAAKHLALSGDTITRSLRQADRVIVTSAMAHRCFDDEGRPSPPIDVHCERLISEREFRRFMGIEAETSISHGSTKADVVRVSGLPERMIDALSLSGLIAPTGIYEFADLSLARKVAAWLRDGFTLPQVIEAYHSTFLGDVAPTSADLELLPHGALAIRRGGTISRRGQLEMPLDEVGLDAYAIFETARAAEDDGDLDAASRLYELLLRVDGRDPDAAFNFGNVLEAKGDYAQARIFYLRALAADPSSADTWCNLGLLAERQGDDAEAERCYSAARTHDPDHQVATWNLAHLLVRTERCADAAHMWEKLASKGGPDRLEALRWARLCRGAVRSPITAPTV